VEAINHELPTANAKHKSGEIYPVMRMAAPP
jgi:hypothetical protein